MLNTPSENIEPSQATQELYKKLLNIRLGRAVRITTKGGFINTGHLARLTNHGFSVNDSSYAYSEIVSFHVDNDNIIIEIV